MTARIMTQGAGSNVGKSMLVAGLARAYSRRGLNVRPFKPQNMSNNAAVTTDGGEIGRAQALQAWACGVAPHTDMNPVLLKPETEVGAQVVVNGKRLATVKARDYAALKPKLMTAVTDSFTRISAESDLMLVEGAGSPAEVNLRQGDIANMGFARAAGVPVCLIGDIDKGGVIASLVGTQSVIDPEDSAMIKGFLINKFRGDPTLFEDGVRAIETRTDWPCFGVIPWLRAPSMLPAEDAVSLETRPHATPGVFKIVAPMLSRMANFDDADPLRMEPDVDFHWVPPGSALPRDADLIVLFGTKSTLGDLDFLRGQGWDHDIHAHDRAGGRVLGICGGYQMLGRKISDPDGVDGLAGVAKGLGLLDVQTVMQGEKRVCPVSGKCARTGLPLSGYEIHAGETLGPDTDRPFSIIRTMPEGATSPCGRIQGTYLHGAFAEDGFRRSWLEFVSGRTSKQLAYDAAIDAALDELAAEVTRAVDVDAFLDLAAPPTLLAKDT